MSKVEKKVEEKPVFVLGKKSLANLEGVHPKLVNCVKEAIFDTTQDFMVFEGVRSVEDEIENIKKGTSHLKDPTHCQHCIQLSGYGQAVDLVPVVKNKPSWDWTYVYPVVRAMKIAEAKRGIKLRWGGVWDRTLDQLSDDLVYEVAAYAKRHKGSDLLDGVHFEIILQNDAPNDKGNPAIIA